MTPTLRLVSTAEPEPLRPFDPEHRGLVVQYHGPETPCPGCHRRQFYVGRITAECAFCETALPIAGLRREQGRRGDG